MIRCILMIAFLVGTYPACAWSNSLPPSPPYTDETKRQFIELVSVFPDGTETSFVEYTDINGQKRQDAMRAVLESRPDLMTWLPEPALRILFDGNHANGEGLNYKLLKDNRVYIIMKVDRPMLPDGRKAEPFGDEFLFYGYLPLPDEQVQRLKLAIACCPQETNQ